MTTKNYEWGYGGTHSYDNSEVIEACVKYTGVAPASIDDAVERLSAHFCSEPRISYDEGDNYFEGGHNDD